jgi:hypothetical protein
LLAALVCGQAIAQKIGSQEALSLRGVALRAITEEQTPLAPRLRLYVDMRPDLRFGGPIPRPEPAPRIGVELKLAPGFAPGIANGTLLRTTLSESTHLSLRARRGGLGVMLSSQF